jgi:hypothetical protein
MIVYIIFLILNLLGMGYLFYANEKQQQINREYLTNAILVNASMEILKKQLDKLQDKVLELEEKLKETKK